MNSMPECLNSAQFKAWQGWNQDLKEHFLELASVLEFDAGMTREIAEERAFRFVKDEAERIKSRCK